MFCPFLVFVLALAGPFTDPPGSPAWHSTVGVAQAQGKSDLAERGCSPCLGWEGRGREGAFLLPSGLGNLLD